MSDAIAFFFVPPRDSQSFVTCVLAAAAVPPSEACDQAERGRAGSGAGLSGDGGVNDGALSLEQHRRRQRQRQYCQRGADRGGGSAPPNPADLFWMPREYMGGTQDNVYVL